MVEALFDRYDEKNYGELDELELRVLLEDLDISNPIQMLEQVHHNLKHSPGATKITRDEFLIWYQEAQYHVVTAFKIKSQEFINFCENFDYSKLPQLS